MWPLLLISFVFGNTTEDKVCDTPLQLSSKIEQDFNSQLTRDLDRIHLKYYNFIDIESSNETRDTSSEKYRRVTINGITYEMNDSAAGIAHAISLLMKVMDEK